MYLYLYLYPYLYLCLCRCLTLCSCLCVGVSCAHFTYARFKETAAGVGEGGQEEKGAWGNLKLNLKVADEVVVLHHKCFSRVASESNEKLLRNV